MAIPPFSVEPAVVPVTVAVEPTSRTSSPMRSPSDSSATSCPVPVGRSPSASSGHPNPSGSTPNTFTSTMPSRSTVVFDFRKPETRSTPSTASTSGWRAWSIGRKPVSGPACPASTTRRSAPMERIHARPSSRKASASPESSRLMANTRAVPMAVMMNRRRRHCRSRSAASNMARNLTDRPERRSASLSLGRFRQVRACAVLRVPWSAGRPTGRRSRRTRPAARRW